MLRFIFKLIFSFLPQLLLAFGCMKWFEGDYQIFILALLVFGAYRIYIWIFDSILIWIDYFLIVRAELENHYIDSFKKNNFPRILEGNSGFTDPVKYLDVVCRGEEFNCDTRMQAAAIIGVFNSFAAENKLQAKKRLSLAFESALHKYYQLCGDNDYYKMAESGYDELFAFGRVSLTKICKDQVEPVL